MITLDIDETDIHSITKAIKRLTNIKAKILHEWGFDNFTVQGSHISVNKLFPMLEGIYNANLDPIYKNKITDKNSNYYVYLHCNPLKILNFKTNRDIRLLYTCTKYSQIKYEPFYVGKGTGDRIDKLSRNEGHRKIRTKIRKNNKEIEVIKLVENLTEQEAFILESKLIDILGLKIMSKDAYLVNLDEGYAPIIRRYLYPDHDFLFRFLQRNGITVKDPAKSGYSKQIKQLKEEIGNVVTENTPIPELLTQAYQV